MERDDPLAVFAGIFNALAIEGIAVLAFVAVWIGAWVVLP